jgi:hypothetical protein
VFAVIPQIGEVPQAFGVPLFMPRFVGLDYLFESIVNGEVVADCFIFLYRVDTKLVAVRRHPARLIPPRVHSQLEGFLKAQAGVVFIKPLPTQGLAAPVGEQNARDLVDFFDGFGGHLPGKTPKITS